VASRPAQPGTAGSQTSGADPSRRPAVSLITSDWLERKEHPTMTIIRTIAELTRHDVRRIKRGR
jgi:hypothetical protein